MTLRAKTDEAEVARENEQKVREALEIERFTRMIKDVKEYFISGMHEFHIFGVPIIIGALTDWDIFVEEFRKEMEYTIYFIHNREGQKEECSLTNYLESDGKCRKIAWWSGFNVSDSNDIEKLRNVIKNYKLSTMVYLMDYAGTRVRASSENIRYYIIFWNLFLAAMDDDIYNEQLAAVAELAACFGFDEPMMRDWCRAVEYVFAGNKLSEDCDLECETVEGAKFFLHKEE